VAAVVDVDGASKRYGTQIAVDDLDLRIGPGTVVGLIGPSGSGKSTAVRLLAGITAPTSGTVHVFGVPPTRFTTTERVRIGYLPQLGVLDPALSLRENLQFVASLYGLPLRRGRRLEEALAAVDLADHARKPLGAASGGMQRRLALAAALLHEPELVFLDEPTAGLDPVLRRALWQRFAALREQGATLVVTTQYVGEAAGCDLVVVLRAGRLVAADTPAGLRRTAAGGDLLEVTAADWLDDGVAPLLRGTPGVLRVERAGTDGRGLRLLVEESGAALPVVQRTLERHGVRVVAAAPTVPSWDDVFVALMERPAP